MGIKESTGGGKGRIFLSLNGKDGTFTQSVKNGETGKWDAKKLAPGTSVEGTLVDIFTKDDKIKDQAVVRGVFVLRDVEPGQPDIQVEFGLWSQSANQPDASVGDTSRFGLGVLAALNAVDIGKPFDMRPWFMAKDTPMGPDKTPRSSDGAGVTVYQGGQKLAPKFIENGQVVEKLAPLPSQVFAGKTHYDKSGWNQVGQDLFAAIEGKLHPADVESTGDHDEEGVDPHAAAEAANAQHARQRA